MFGRDVYSMLGGKGIFYVIPKCTFHVKPKCIIPRWAEREFYTLVRNVLSTLGQDVYIPRWTEQEFSTLGRNVLSTLG